MALTRETWIETEQVSDSMPAAATESSVAPIRVDGDTTSTGIERGALVGFRVYSDQADTATVRFYRDTGSATEIVSVDITYTGAAWGGYQLTHPIPFFDPLQWTVEFATGSPGTYKIEFDVRGIA